MLAKKAKEVLIALQGSGLLPELVLIGSWCCHFYVSHFGRENYLPTIQTLDLDLLIPEIRTIKKKVSVPEMLKSLDFDPDFTFSGWLRFVHPELRVEFLVPQLGIQPDDPKKISQLQITAMPLRHTFVLTQHTITIKDDDLQIRIPHPLAFALHKLFVSNRRKEKGKSLRDKEMAYRILDVIQTQKQTKELPSIWSSFTKKEKAEIVRVLEKDKRDDLISMIGVTK